MAPAREYQEHLPGHHPELVPQGGGLGVETAKSWYMACSCGYCGSPRPTRLGAALAADAHLCAVAEAAE